MSVQALLRIATATADAVEGVLSTLAPGAIEARGCAVVPDSSSPLAGMPVPGVVCRVFYTEGVTGGNIVGISTAGAHRLAAAMTGGDPTALEDHVLTMPLDELEVSAVAEATNQMMAAAAQATGKVLGMEIDISPPVTAEIVSLEEAEDLLVHAPNATSAGFSVAGEPCRFVQLMPHAFTLRVERALDELEDSFVPEAIVDPHTRSGLEAALASVSVRMSAELGRTPRPVGDVLGLPSGSVLELNRDADDPIDLYVNGARFATGRLVVGEDARWAVRIESILTPGPNPPTNEGG